MVEIFVRDDSPEEKPVAELTPDEINELAEWVVFLVAGGYVKVP